MKCLDTYPLIEISSGNNKFLGFLNEKIIIPNLILIEFYGLMYRKYNLKTAEYWYNKLLQFKVDVSIEILKKAIIFKNDNNKSNISFSFNTATVKITANQGRSRTFINQRGVISGPDGAVVLPYFHDGRQWLVVLVEQFRIALSKQTMEATGGELDAKNVRAGMARELYEETGISVNPKRVYIVFSEFAAGMQSF